MPAELGRAICVLALGSQHGDDRVAWSIAEQLARDPIIQPYVHTLATPWDLVEILEPNSSVVVIDACEAEAAPGSVLRITEKELAAFPAARQSTHGGSLSESLALARTLGKPVRELVVFAIAVESCEPGSELSESARCAVDDAVQQVQALLSEWLPKQ